MEETSRKNLTNRFSIHRLKNRENFNDHLKKLKIIRHFISGH